MSKLDKAKWLYLMRRMYNCDFVFRLVLNTW
jgi:hypothetical protein